MGTHTLRACAVGGVGHLYTSLTGGKLNHFFGCSLWQGDAKCQLEAFEVQCLVQPVTEAFLASPKQRKYPLRGIFSFSFHSSYRDVLSTHLEKKNRLANFSSIW